MEIAHDAAPPDRRPDYAALWLSEMWAPVPEYRPPIDPRDTHPTPRDHRGRAA